MWDCRPRMLWQKLFDFYREQGCKLEHLDNLLIDFVNCQKLFDEELLNLNEKTTVHFIFGCDPGYSNTTWIPQKHWKTDDVRILMTYANYDRYLVCSVNCNRAKLIPVIVEG